MRKIAIIFTTESYGSDDDIRRVVESITDWTEVSEDDFKVLQNESWRGKFQVLERPLNDGEFVKKTVADHIKAAKQEKERQAAEKAVREQKALERKHKKELKDKESKLKLLKQLQEEFGVETK